MSTHHEQATPRKAGKSPAHQFPEPSLYPVAHHRRANRTANYKAYLRAGVLGYRTGGQEHMSRQGRAADPAARAHCALELFRAPHPRLLRQHDPSSKARGGWPLIRSQPPLLPVDTQTASWSRPLRRRAARTARPARVRIRSRKPWTLARRRLFGWKVRLLTGTPGIREDALNQERTCHTPRPAARLTSARAALQTRHGSACLRYGGSA